MGAPGQARYKHLMIPALGERAVQDPVESKNQFDEITTSATQAISEVRASAVDIAVEAARALLAAKVDVKAGADLFKASLADVKAKLN